MDSLLSSPTGSVGLLPERASQLLNQSETQADSQVIQSLSNTLTEDKVEVAFNDLYKALAVTANEVLTKLNEILKPELPDGIESLNPEDHTSEKTAQRIVDQVTGFFGAFADQHPELEGEELVNSFMSEIRGGVDKGYDEAFSILEDIGAFQFDGVQSGVEKTKSLIDSKLSAFETTLREQLGIDSKAVQEVSKTTTDELLAQGGVATLSIAA